MPHRHHTPPHFPHHGPGGPHGPEWYFNATGEIARSAFFDQISELAVDLSASGSVQLGDTQLEVPEMVFGIVRYERVPHGALALEFRIEWSESNGSVLASSPINALRAIAER